MKFGQLRCYLDNRYITLITEEKTIKKFDTKKSDYDNTEVFNIYADYINGTLKIAVK